MTYPIQNHTIKRELISTLSISVPLVASQLIYASSNFIGTAMVARLGEDALAASVLVSMIWASLSVFFFGLLNSVSVLVSHEYGAKNHDAISRIMGQGFVLGLLMIVLIILIMLMVPFFLHLSAQPAPVLALANVYTRSLLWTVPALVFLIIAEQFLAGVNRAKIVLRISLLVVPLEIPIIYILVFGKFGLPAYGVAGVGYGFAVSYTLTTIGLLIYLMKSKAYSTYRLFDHLYRIQFTYLKEMIRIGLPMGFMHVIEVSTFSLVTFWIGHFSTTLLAAHQIAMQYLGFTITLVFAMSQAVTVRVGHAFGEKNLTAIRYASYAGMYLNCVAVAIIAILFIFMPNLFLRLDINLVQPENRALIHDAAMLLSIGAVLLVFDNFRIVGFGALRGLKDTKFPMYASLISFWLVGLSTAYLLAFYFQMGGAGIWWGLTTGIAVGAVIVHWRLRRKLMTFDLSKPIAIL